MCRAVSCVVRSEPLLTADEVAALLSDADIRQSLASTGTAAEAPADDNGPAAPTSKEEESRREAEALEGLLWSNSGGGGDGGGTAVPGGAAAQSALTRLAARYLVRETVRGRIPDPVGNFHVRARNKCFQPDHD